MLKKAKELSHLCDAEIVLIIYSPTGKIHQFSSHNMYRTIGKYRNFTKQYTQPSENIETLKLEAEKLQKEMEDLEKIYRCMIGEDLSSLCFKKLQHLEKKMKLGVRKIRSKQDKISRERIRSLKAKHQTLKEENDRLRKEPQLGTSHSASDINLDIVEGFNDKLETDGPTQQDLPRTSLNLRLSRIEGDAIL